MGNSDYTDRYFVPVENAKEGEVSGGSSSTCEGEALGRAHWSGRWMQTPTSPFSTSRGIHDGPCRSTLKVIENGRYRLHESWRGRVKTTLRIVR